jgi:hypothetical protein
MIFVILQIVVTSGGFQVFWGFFYTELRWETQARYVQKVSTKTEFLCGIDWCFF